MKTGLEVEYELIDTGALDDSTMTTSFNSEFGNIMLLKDRQEFEDYATLEQDYVLLDGSFDEMPDVIDNIPFFSDVMSDENGEYAENVTLLDTFAENHTSIGLTFYFVGDHPLEMKITWYDLSGLLLSTKEFKIDANVYFAKNQIENYGKLKIEFTKAKPYRFVKFYYIEYGETITWTHETLKTGTLNEEVDPISNQISINKLKFAFVDVNNEFNFGNQDGMHKVLQKKQKLTPYELINGTKIKMGKFYVSDFNTASNITTFNCYSRLEKLDSTDFKEGGVYNGVKAGILIDKVMEAAGVTDYTVDSVTYDTLLYGTLKSQTCRKALREILFATGSIADTGRSENINIYKQNRVMSNTIGRDRKLLGFKTTVDDYVSDVIVKYDNWAVKTTSSKIKTDTYSAGTHTVEFSNPVSGITIEGAALVKANTYYCTFTLAVDGTVSIYGYNYENTQMQVTASVKKVKAGEEKNSKSFTSTLCNYERAKAIANSILDFYSLQLIIQGKIINEGEAVAKWVQVANEDKTHGNYIAGVLTLSTDLTGGNISTIKMRGYYDLQTEKIYCGELYCGEDIGYL